MTPKELIEKRLQKIAQAKAILEKAEKEKRDLTAEEDGQFAALHKEASELKQQADAIFEAEQRAAQRAATQAAAEEETRRLQTHGIDLNRVRGSAAGAMPQNGRGTREDFALALQGWLINQSDSGIELDARHREAADRCGLNLAARTLTMRLPLEFAELRNAIRLRNALSTQTGSTGGFTIPEGFIGRLEVAMLAFGAMLQTSEVIRTTTANPMPWPTANDTSNSGRQIGESQAVASLDPTFGSKTWLAYKFTSDEILVPFELLRDNAVNLEQILAEMLGERLGRILNTKFTTGSGAATPHGIVPASTMGKTTAGATAITADELIDLQHSIDPAYRPQSSWMFHDNVAAALRKLKDGNSRYHWQDGMQAGQPDRLFTQPVSINQAMQSSIATATKTAIYGDLSKYKVRQVNAIRLYRLTERHRENDQDAFLAFIEADGGLLNAGTNPVKHLLQA